MNNDIYAKRRTLVIVLIVIFVVLGAVATIYSIWYKTTYSASVLLTVAPQSATTTLNGKVEKNGSTYKIKPGKYTVVIKKSGFTTITLSITAKKNKTTTVAEALISNNPATANWYDQHPDDQKINEAVGASNASQAETEISTSFKIATILPLAGPTYEVNYGASPDKKGQYAVFVTYYGATGKQDAISAVQSLGYNISDYEVFYTDGDTGN